MLVSFSVTYSDKQRREPIMKRAEEAIRNPSRAKMEVEMEGKGKEQGVDAVVPFKHA